MNNAEIIKGINETIAGLERIKNALAVEEGVPAKATKTVAKEETAKTAPAKEEKKQTATESTGAYSREELEAMKYNDLKKLGASLGVKCTGTRDEIVDKILAVADAPAETEDGAEEAPAKKSDKSDKSNIMTMEEGKKKLGKKSVKEEADEEDEFDKQAKEVAEETDAEDIIEALAEVGVKATEKNCVAKLADALRKGLIDLSDEEDEADDEEPTEGEDDTTDEDAEITADTYFHEFDPNGYNDPEEMSEERAEAIRTMIEEVLQAIEDEEIGEDDITSFIEDNATEDEKELLPDDYTEEQLIGFYLELRKRFIDNEGNEHDPSDPYELGEENFCCGHKLKYVKKNKTFICETCGEEYEAD